jgi:biopolymer transport protein ExbD
MLMDRTSPQPKKLFKRRVRVRPRVEMPVVAAVVFAALWVIFAVVPPPPHNGVSADLPYVHNAIYMPGALRRDALMLNITRDGKNFFGNELLARPEQLSDRVRKMLPSARDRKVYIKADARVHYGVVRLALAQLQIAGIQNIAFLTDQPTSTR